MSEIDDEIDDESSWNYETWAASEGLRVGGGWAWHVRELVGKVKRGAVERGCAEQWLLADWLKEWMERDAPKTMPRAYDELLQAALMRIDWHEVAGCILDTGEPVLGQGRSERGECPV